MLHTKVFKLVVEYVTGKNENLRERKIQSLSNMIGLYVNEMYRHIVQYYETDKMGITHHSNYIRWMEEARVDFLEKIGWSYAKLEEEGITSPVVAVECKYRQPTTFSDAVDIEVLVSEFKGVKLKLKYVMKNDKGNTVCEACSEHCFLDEKGIPIRLKKEYPLFYDALIEWSNK